MSTLLVNNLNSASGTTITVPSGKTLIAPGHILQVQRTYVASQVPAISTSSQSMAASGIICSITPKQTGSMILIDFISSMVDATAADTINMKMYFSIGGGSYNTMAGATDYHIGIQSAIRWAPAAFGAKYTTTSTATLSYQPYFKSVGGNPVRIVHDSASYALTLMEVAQ